MMATIQHSDTASGSDESKNATVTFEENTVTKGDNGRPNLRIAGQGTASASKRISKSFRRFAAIDDNNKSDREWQTQFVLTLLFNR